MLTFLLAFFTIQFTCYGFSESISKVQCERVVHLRNLQSIACAIPNEKVLLPMFQTAPKYYKLELVQSSTNLSSIRHLPFSLMKDMKTAILQVYPPADDPLALITLQLKNKSFSNNEKSEATLKYDPEYALMSSVDSDMSELFCQYKFSLYGYPTDIVECNFSKALHLSYELIWEGNSKPSYFISLWVSQMNYTDIQYSNHLKHSDISKYFLLENSDNLHEQAGGNNILHIHLSPDYCGNLTIQSTNHAVKRSVTVNITPPREDSFKISLKIENQSSNFLYKINNSHGSLPSWNYYYLQESGDKNDSVFLGIKCMNYTGSGDDSKSKSAKLCDTPDILDITKYYRSAVHSGNYPKILPLKKENGRIGIATYAFQTGRKYVLICQCSTTENQKQNWLREKYSLPVTVYIIKNHDDYLGNISLVVSQFGKHFPHNFSLLENYAPFKLSENSSQKTDGYSEKVAMNDNYSVLLHELRYNYILNKSGSQKRIIASYYFYIPIVQKRLGINFVVTKFRLVIAASFIGSFAFAFYCRRTYYQTQNEHFIH